MLVEAYDLDKKKYTFAPDDKIVLTIFKPTVDIVEHTLVSKRFIQILDLDHARRSLVSMTSLNSTIMLVVTTALVEALPTWRAPPLT